VPTPFISASTLKNATRRLKAREYNITMIAMIDHEIQKEGGGGVRSARDMVVEVGLQLTPAASRWLRSTEWLCQEQVPAKAIKKRPICNAILNHFWQTPESLELNQMARFSWWDPKVVVAGLIRCSKAENGDASCPPTKQLAPFPYLTVLKGFRDDNVDILEKILISASYVGVPSCFEVLTY
jgi:hypothetical protein